VRALRCLPACCFAGAQEEQLLIHIFSVAKEGDADSVINEIDRFAQQQWMMNVGDVKGKLLDDEVQKKQPKHAVELGAYCGYSALRIAKQLPEGGRLTSIEINPLNVRRTRTHTAQVGRGSGGC